MTDREGGDAAPGGRSRGEQSGRDVLLSMVPLALVVLGEVRLLITGSGTQEQFRILAAATLDVPVLPS